jgi:membrane DNA delivery protein
LAAAGLAVSVVELLYQLVFERMIAMGEKLIESVTTVAVAITGIAIIAVLVSGNAKTSQVIQSGSAGLAQDIQAAVSPVSGGSFNFGGGAFLPNNY